MTALTGKARLAEILATHRQNARQSEAENAGRPPPINWAPPTNALNAALASTKAMFEPTGHRLQVSVLDPRDPIPGSLPHSRKGFTIDGTMFIEALHMRDGNVRVDFNRAMEVQVDAAAADEAWFVERFLDALAIALGQVPERGAAPAAA
jgi:hypothetical protein